MSWKENLDRPVMQIQPGEWTEEFSCMACGNSDFTPIFPVPENFSLCNECGQRYWLVEKPKGS